MLLGHNDLSALKIPEWQTQAGVLIPQSGGLRQYYDVGLRSQFGMLDPRWHFGIRMVQQVSVVVDFLRSLFDPMLIAPCGVIIRQFRKIPLDHQRPIFLCSLRISAYRSSWPSPAPRSNSSASRSLAVRFHWLTWFGCSWCRAAMLHGAAPTQGFHRHPRLERCRERPSFWHR